MLKLLDFDQGFFKDEPLFTVLDFSAQGGMVKSATDSRIQEFASKIDPEAGKTYVHILAMGAGEYYGANRNADYFPEENLKNYHETFFTSPAHIFKHHINKNPDIAIGKVIFSVYNERMKRVEVIAWVDNLKGKDYVDRINAGEFPSTSMACHTPYDTCSVCGNKARSRQAYCVHLKTQLGKLLPNGQKVMALNDGPLRFFDMSFVFKPADVTSSVLQKLAEEQGAAVLGSAESAELHGLPEKKASIRKLSELIKEVEGQVVGSSPSLEKILDKVKDPDHDVLNTLVHFDLHHVLNALCELGISPSLSFFTKLIGQKIANAPVDGIEVLVQGLMQEDPDKVNVPEYPRNIEKSASQGFAEKKVVQVLLPFYKQSSLFAEPIMGRSFDGYYDRQHDRVLVNSNNIGYVDNGPYPVTDTREMYRKFKIDQESRQSPHSPGLLKTLFMIGGAAIAAKWLLSKMIEDKIKEQSNSNLRTKIVLVKSANDLDTSDIIRTDLLKSLKF